MANELARNGGPILALKCGSSSLKSKVKGSQQSFYAVGRLR
jgi:hypothetical protein